MTKERFDEKLQARSEEVFSKTPSGFEKPHLTAKYGARQVNNTINPKPHDTPKVPLSPPQTQGRLPGQLIQISGDSPEPYVSVGCLKCGASDHIATNRNCPRPRKAAPVTYTAPALAHATKRSTPRSPKKSTTDNHHLKEAKMGDDTKFWYYISDNSEDGEQRGSKPGKKLRMEQCGIEKEQDSSAAHAGYNHKREEGFRTVPGPTEESTQLGLMSEYINKDSEKLRKDTVTHTVRNYNRVSQTINYGVPVLNGPQVQVENRQNLDKLCDWKDLGPIPSLPWKVSMTTASLLPPIKHSGSYPRNEGRIMKTPRQRKIATKPPIVMEDRKQKVIDSSLRDHSRKEAQTSHAIPTKVITREKSQKTASVVTETTPGAVHSHYCRQPSPAHSSRHSTAAQRQVNRISTQTVEDTLSAAKVETTRFKCNYMGARNTVQKPRVQYAPNRVQGWRECRSMGTGLE